MKYRLLLGPVMLLALLALLWLDERLALLPLPESLRALAPLGETHFPAGMLLLLVGLAIVPLAARELGAMFHAGNIAASRRMMTLAGMAGLLVSAAIPFKSSPSHAVALVASVAALVLVASLLWHVRDRQTHGAAAAVGAAMLAFTYLGLMFGFLLALRREHSAWIVLGVLVVTKAADIGAFFTGKALGRHKLIPWLSPGKTWEGLAGGVLTSALIAWLGVHLAHTHLPASHVGSMPTWQALFSGALLALVGQGGDLLESVLKRDAGLKDSGHSIPGFGGVLDVLDSVLLTAPVAFWLLTFSELGPV